MESLCKVCKTDISSEYEICESCHDHWKRLWRTKKLHLMDFPRCDKCPRLFQLGLPIPPKANPNNVIHWFQYYPNDPNVQASLRVLKMRNITEGLHTEILKQKFSDQVLILQDYQVRTNYIKSYSEGSWWNTLSWSYFSVNNIPDAHYCVQQALDTKRRDKQRPKQLAPSIYFQGYLLSIQKENEVNNHQYEQGLNQMRHALVTRMEDGDSAFYILLNQINYIKRLVEHLERPSFRYSQYYQQWWNELSYWITSMPSEFVVTQSEYCDSMNRANHLLMAYHVDSQPSRLQLEPPKPNGPTFSVEECVVIFRNLLVWEVIEED
eukprot:TRINITY_DN11646_c0_g1_i1.p1 TRINITY_DN11646_c0_g1~~TRINITY_DN11646_c0_g1_i1.p1  ORF type:complete len:322 (-),score=52.22 TRINITY_DN11646_c0_g1_i1:41-1006(-)